MIPSEFVPIANHLWQSTLFAGIAGLLTLLLKKNRAHTRYCLWLAASAKFLVPLSLFVALGSQFGRNAAITPLPDVPAIVEQVNEPFGSQEPALATRPQRTATFLLPAVIVVWAVGFGILVFSWSRQWRKLRAALRSATPIPLAVGVPVRSSGSFMEPGVFGVFRPVLLLPEGLAARLSPAEFRAILAHELCHLRRRDNLATALHMVVEAVFWFHPVVWWLGARLMDERERACDEEVLRTGSQPKAYAEGILKICELYLQSPLKCVAGVTGANLKRRIEAIMSNRPALKLNLVKRIGLAMSGILAVAIPMLLGIANAPALRAQVDPDLRFEVATIKRAEVPPARNGGVPVFPTTGGVGTPRITYRATWLGPLIATAFGIRSDQITAPEWLNKERWDIAANIPEGTTKEQFNVMLANLLRDRFHLRFHIESKDQPVYVLRVAKGGPKFKETTVTHDSDDAAPPAVSGGFDAEGFLIMPPNRSGMVSMPRPGEIFTTAQDVPMSTLASHVQSPATGIDRPVLDETGLTGRYDFKLRMQWGRVTGLGDSPNVFTAIEEQLGLKLERARRPLDHLVIDSIDREPTEN